MGHRLSKIATRTGDSGETGLGDGSRVAKDNARIEALGTVDELNSAIGLMLCEDIPADVRGAFETVQHDLFDLGGELSIPGYTLIREDQVIALDGLLERWNADLPALREFVLPGGSRASAAAHLARTVCRRAERCLYALGRSENVSDLSRQYLNRLSDLLFVSARVLNRHAGRADVQWQRSGHAAK